VKKWSLAITVPRLVGLSEKPLNRAHWSAMFLSGTLLNVATVLLGTTIGLVAGRRLPARLGEGLTTGLGLFVAVIAVTMAGSIFSDPAAQPGDELAVLGGLLAGVAVGELLGLQEWLESLGSWFQRRLSSGDQPSRVAEGFVTASLVFCVGPLTILGSLENGLRGDVTLLSTKALLDGVASVAFAAALGAGVYLSAVTVLIVQGAIAAGAFLLRDVLDPRTILAISSTGGLILVGVALRLLDLKAVRVANFLPALVLAPLFLRFGDLLRSLL
jgi:uncharacterized membrane protein YqgA involved in biofilm formation